MENTNHVSKAVALISLIDLSSLNQLERDALVSASRLLSAVEQSIFSNSI